MDAESDDIEFEPEVGRIGRDRGSSLMRLRAAIRIAGRLAGPKLRQGSRTGLRAHFAKGSKGLVRVAQLGQRRVVVKARYVAHGGGRGAPLRAHIAYLAREARGASRDPAAAVEAKRNGELDRSVSYLGRESEPDRTAFSFYNQRETDLDAKALTAAWADDARHFRLIISPEDGEALGDFRPFIREVMAGLESRLGTGLEWVAVNHHDTDNPHAHVLIRGRRTAGRDLFIPSKLISSGIREHAQEIATRVLGPRQVVDLVQERARDISVRGVSPLDRELLRRLDEGRALAMGRPDLAARLERLEGWALAHRAGAGWRLEEDLLGKLRSLEKHAAVEEAVSHVRRRGELRPLLAAEPNTPVIGELIHLGPADDLGETFLAVVENGVGEMRYATFERVDDLSRLAEVERGAIVAFDPVEVRVRPSDEAVARIAGLTGGEYSARHHTIEEPRVSEALLAANIRRLEAMRRAGMAERRSDGVFEIRDDHLDRALAFERRIARASPLTSRVASYWTLAEQVEALGPTHLDRVLAGVASSPVGGGAYAQRHATALQQRRLFLIEQGLMGRDDRSLSSASLSHMADLEISGLARRLSKELGVAVSTAQVASMRGVYARRIDLAQGRVALILGERAAHLVPWRPALERFAGREVAGVLRGQSLSWGLARAGPSLPPM